MNYPELIETTRKIRTKTLKPVAQFLLKLKLTANRMTLLSFVLGAAAMYFLFQNHLLFVVFAALHLIADGLDGVLARLTKANTLGKYLDYFTDRSIFLLALIKTYLYLQDYYILLIVVLFIIMQTIYLFSKFQYPTFFFRTGSLIYLSFSPLFPLKLFFTAGYFIIGVLTIFYLLLQFKYFLRTKTYSS